MPRANNKTAIIAGVAALALLASNATASAQEVNAAARDDMARRWLAINKTWLGSAEMKAVRAESAPAQTWN